jgi:type III restriction enzyme
LNNELRVLEELYYYTYDEDSRYISHLKKELKRDGYIRDDKVVKKFALKDEFKDSDFYTNTAVWYNNKIKNPERRKNTLEDLKNQFSMKYKIQDLELIEQEVEFDEDNGDTERLSVSDVEKKTFTIYFKDIEKHIFRKAMNIKAKSENSFFQFERLRYELSINSIDDLQNQEYFGNCSIDIISTKNNDYSTISNEDKLNFTLKFLTNAFDVLKGYIKPYKGSEFKPGSFEMFFGDPKIKAVEVDQESERLSKALENKEWYALNTFVGTDEERELIRFIMDTFANIDTIYQDIYLLRNEEVYKIFDFDQGRGFQPDFLLFLWNENEDVYYQVFIEPKGPRRTGDEDWKEEFLREISNQYGIDNVIRAENTKYKLIGLPFFTTQRDIFQREFRDKLNIE